MTIQELLMLLLRRWRVVGFAILLGGLAGFLYASSQPSLVETEGRLLIGPSLEGDLNVIESTGSLSRGTLQQTLAEIMSGNQVTRVARRAADNTSTAYEVESVVVPETNLVKLTVTGPEGEEAMTLASAVMSVAQRTFEDLYPVYALAVVDEPDDWTQTAPNPQLGLLVGLLLGATLASIGVAAAGTADRRLRTDERTDELEEAWGPGPQQADVTNRYRVLLEELEDLLELDRAEWLRERLKDARRTQGNGGHQGPVDDAAPPQRTMSEVRDARTGTRPEDASTAARPQDDAGSNQTSTRRPRRLEDPGDVTPRTG